MSFSSRDANGPGPLLPHSRPGVGQDWFAVQSPDKSGLPFAIRGVGADRSTFPSVVRGAPGVASFSHCAATGTDTGAMATTSTSAATSLDDRDMSTIIPLPAASASATTGGGT